MTEREIAEIRERGERESLRRRSLIKRMAMRTEARLVREGKLDGVFRPSSRRTGSWTSSAPATSFMASWW